MKHLKIFETYNSHIELVELATDIIHLIVQETYGSKIKDGLENILLKDVNINNYKILKDFMLSFGSMIIQFSTAKYFNNSKAKGMFVVKEDSTILIGILMSDYDIKKWNEYIDEDYDISRIIGIINNSFHNNLLHELQHAYDYYRRNKKKFKDDIDTPDIAKNVIHYHNSEHEMSSQFTQTLDKIDFYDFDIDISIEYNVNFHKLKPFNEIKKEFIRAYVNFHILSPVNRQQILKRLGKIYEEEKVNKLLVKDLPKKGINITITSEKELYDFYKKYKQN